MALNALLNRLGQSMGAIQRFTADALPSNSHALDGNPHAFGAAWPARPQKSAAGRSALADIADGVGRVERMSKQLLALARADEHPEAFPEAVPVDLTHVLEETVAQRFPEARKKGMTIEVDRPDEPVLALGDEVLISELIANCSITRSATAIQGAMSLPGSSRKLASYASNSKTMGQAFPSLKESACLSAFIVDRRMRADREPDSGLAIVRAVCDRIGAGIELSDGSSGSGLLVTVTFRTAGRDET